MTNDQNKNGAIYPAEHPQSRPGIESSMRIEATQILKDQQFLNAPMLARLFNWLVEETLAGRGDRIKSYTIAVEGLGRPDDFDSQSDSYPRVQIGRLRKALETYYAKHGPIQLLCLYLQPGSYRVRAGGLDRAYPQLYRPLSQESSVQIIPDDIAADNNVPLEVFPLSATNFMSRKSNMLLIAAALIAALLITVAVLSGSGQSSPAKVMAKHSNSPVVVLAPIAGGDGSQSASIANSAYAIIADGLSRSWVAQVRIGGETETSSSGWTAAKYRLEMQLGDGRNGETMLFVRLNEIDSSTVVWSTSQPIDTAKPLVDNLGPVIAQLTGPFGAIASNESRLTKDRFDPGYICLLRYLSFLKSRDQKLGTRVFQCLQKPAPENRLEAVRYALLAFYSFEAENAVSQRGANIQDALQHSRRAIEINPNEAYAQFAMARTYFINSDCSSGHRYAQLAFSANPYDPIILAILGNFSSICGYDEGLEMLDKAYQYRVDGESYARLSLILSSIRSGQLDRLPSLRDAGANQDGIGLAYHYLCETLIAAALGETTSASENWEQFVAASPEPRNSPDKMLRHVILADVVRAKVTLYLSTKRVI